MTLILIWLAASALVGWFGRKRLIGFWGFFVVSIFLTPVLTGLFLLLASPGKRFMEETEERIAEELRHAAVEKAAQQAATRVAMPVAVHVRIPTVRRLATAWLIVLLVFAGIYLGIGPDVPGLTVTQEFGVIDALRLSFDVSTMGSGGEAINTGLLQWVAAIQRLLVLGILVMLVATLISAQIAAFKTNPRNGNGHAAHPHDGSTHHVTNGTHHAPHVAHASHATVATANGTTGFGQSA